MKDYVVKLGIDSFVIFFCDDNKICFHMHNRITKYDFFKDINTKRFLKAIYAP